MARINGISIPGVTAQKDKCGRIVGVSVNFKRCSHEIRSFFRSLGLHIEEPKEPKYDPKFVQKIKESASQPSVEININDYL